MLFEVVVIHNTSYLLIVFCKLLRAHTKPEIWVCLNPVWQVSLQGLDLRRHISRQVLILSRNSLAHVLQVNELGIFKIKLHPVLRLLSVCLVLNRLLVVNSVEVSSLFFRELAEIVVGDVTFLAAIKVFEDDVELINLELETHMVQALLELVEAHSVVEVDVEVAICFGHSLESISDLDPNEVEHLLERTTLIVHVVRCWTAVCVAAHKVKHIGRVVALGQFLHR